MPKYDHLFAKIALQRKDIRIIFFSSTETERRFLRERLVKVFAESGLIFSEHCEVLPWLTKRAFFDLMASSTIAIDTPAFSGFNTAIQSIWCDLPMVTIRGGFLRNRLAAGVLERIGLEDLAADTEEQYLSIVNTLLCNESVLKEKRDHIKSHKHRIFRDVTPIREFENFIHREMTNHRQTLSPL